MNADHDCQKSAIDWGSVTWTKLATGIISPEGPAVDRAGHVYLVSRWTGRVVTCDPLGQVREIVHTGGKPQSVALLESGELLVPDAKNHALLGISAMGNVRVLADTLTTGGSLLGPNDLVLAEHDIVYMTDPGLDLQAPGRIVRIDLRRQETTVLSEGHRFPNGITITADGRYLLVAESVTHRVLRFALLDGGVRLGPAEVFYQFADHYPDGMALDAAGNLLVAMCGGGTLEVIGPDGQHLASIPTGGSQTTNCVFGGPDFQTLYLTEDKQEGLLMTRWPIPGQQRYSRSLPPH